MRRSFWSRFASLALLLAATASRASAAADVGQAAPGLIVTEVGGSTIDLAALRGKVVIVNLWATWCSPCREEMPILDTFYRRQHDRGVELLGLSMDRSREREAVKKVAQTVIYPIAIVADAKVNGFGAIRVLPVTYIIDTAGTLRARLPPDAPLTEERLEEVVLPLLPGQQGTPTP
jgi:cytochrome c biogenesis protein CcmG/thiol:disulfide interchange protein DsbE